MDKAVVRQSDALFADMMTNTQGIYKAKKLCRDTEQYIKAKKHFSEVFNKNKHYFGKKDCEDIFENLVESGDLYWMDYEVLRWM